MSQQAFVNFGDVLCLNLHQKDAVVLGDSSVSNQLYVDDPVRPNRPVHNLPDGCFVLVQRFQYSAKKVYEKALRSNTLGLTHTNWRVKLDPGEPLYNTMAEHLRRFGDEKETNRMEYERKVGYSATYGTTVQLRHHASNKFVTQSKNRAEQDRLAMEVSLVEDGSEGSWWKVWPAEKVRTEGERVQYGDKVVLENVKFGNSWLYVALANPVTAQGSDTTHPYVQLHPAARARFEVNASAIASSFEVRLVRRQAENRSHDSMAVSPTLLGLDVVTLYHRQQDAYLCSSSPPGPVFWLPSGVWRHKEGVQPGCLWRVQPAALDGAGSSIARESAPFVLQHLASGAYAGAEGGALVLTPDVHKSKCLWNMKAHDSTRTTSLRRSSACARRTRQGCGLQLTGACGGSIASGDIVWIREGPKPGGQRGWLAVSSDADGQADGRIPAVITPGAVASNVDVVELSVRPMREWGSLNHLRASKEVLTAALKCIESLQPLPEDVTDEDELVRLAQRHPRLRSSLGAMRSTVVECLGELIRGCSRSATRDPILRSGPPVREFQDLVRESCVLHLAMQMIVALLDRMRLPVKRVRQDLKEVFEIGQLCYKLIEKTCHQNAASKAVMADKLQVIMRHSNGEMGAYFAMLEIYIGMRKQLESITDEAFSNMIEYLKNSYGTGGGTRILHFMTEQCHAGEFPIKRNQDRVAQAVFGELQHLVFRVETSSGSARLVDVSAGEEHAVTVDLGDKMEIDESWVDRTDLYQLPLEQQKFVYHLSMIDLMTWSIFGRNEHACALIEANAAALGVTYEQLLQTVTSPGVPAALRQKCCDLISRIYIDRDPAEPVTLFLNTRIWRSALYSKFPVAGQPGVLFPEIKALCGADDPGATEAPRFASLQEALLGLLPESTNVEETQVNRFTLAQLRVLLDLVKFGHYHTLCPERLSVVPDFPAIRNVTAKLLKTLDGRTDFCAPFGSFGPDEARFQEAEKTNIVMCVKLKILNILSSFFQCAQGERITRFVQFWEGILTRLGADNEELFNDAVKVQLSKSASARDLPLDTPGNEKAESKDGGGLANGNGSSHGVTTGSQPANGVGANQVAPAPDYNISQYIADESKWKTMPPWAAHELKKLQDDLFGGSALISDEFSSSKIAAMFQRTSSWFVPDWVRILLDLVRYHNSELKEKAMAFLLSSFSQHPNFIRLVKTTQFVWERDMAACFFRSRSDVSRLRHLKNHVTSHQPAARETGCAAAQAIMEQWAASLSSKQGAGGDRGKELQQMLAALGAVEAVVGCLHAPLHDDAGALLHCRKKLFQSAYDFLGRLCERNEPLQEKLLPYWDMLTQHVGILNAESVLHPMITDNLRVVDAVGPRAIAMVFRKLVEQETRRAGWLLILTALVKCKGKAIKENQALVMSEFRKSEEQVALLMKSSAEWDARIQLMSTGDYWMACGGSQLAFHLAVVRLLAVSSVGKNPAAEVYASNYFSLRDVVRVLLRGSVNSRGEAVEVDCRVLADVKREFCNFLFHVYVDTAVTRLAEELSREGNGVWGIDPVDEEHLGTVPLMAVLRDDIRAFTAMCLAAEGVAAEELLVTGQYVCGVLCPMLASYFGKVYPRAHGAEDGTEALAMEVFEAAKALFEAALPEAVLRMDLYGEAVDGKREVWNLLEAMSRKARVGVEWQRNPRNSTYVEDTQAVVQRERMFAEDLVAAAFYNGYLQLVEQLAVRMGILDTEKLIGTGLLQLTMMLCRDGRVRLYEDDMFIHLGRTTPTNPKYHDFVMAMLEISRSGTTDAAILRDILRIVRAMVYVLEPGKPERTPEQSLPQWKAFLQFQPAVKEGVPAKPLLRWVQDRLDAMGASVAGMRLLKTESRQVRLSAAALLVSLLQGTNRRVQGTLHAYLASKKDAVFFRVVSEVLDQAMEGLKEHKRNLKIALRTNASTASRSGRSPSARAGGGANDEGLIGAGFGKTSTVMVTLRLLQLMCVGQYTALQDMLLRQPSAAQPVNVVQKVVDLLEAVQPLINDSLAFRDGDVALLAVQLLDTLAELLQGPNESNQRYLLGSSFLAVVNRMFSSTFYLPIPDGDQAHLHGSDMSANDLRAHLKVALLGACHAMLEGAAAKEAQYLLKMLEYFESRNLYLQVVECGRVLGLTTEVEEVEEDGIGADDGVGFGGRASSIGSAISLGLGSITSKTGRGSVSDGVRSQRSGAMGGSMTSRATARLRDAQASFKFSEGFKNTVEKEMFMFYTLMVSLVDFNARDAAVHAMQQKLRELSTKHKDLRSYLERHTGEVEISRRNRVSGRRLVEKVRFSVTEEVFDLAQGRGFIASAEEQMFDVPRDNPQEKAKAFVRKLLALRESMRWLLKMGSNPKRRFLIRNRDRFNQLPFYLAALITLCLLLFYGVPMDPNTGGILGGGMFFPVDTAQAPPAGYTHERYPWAEETSDPGGQGAWYGSVLSATDLSVKFRLALQTRWASKAEWAMFPEGELILCFLGAMHFACSVLNAVVHMVQDLPLAIGDVLERHRRLPPRAAAAASALSSFGPGSKASRAAHSSADGKHGEQAHNAHALLRGSAYLDNPPPIPTEPSIDAMSVALHWDLFWACRMTTYHGLLCSLSLLGLLSSPLFFVFLTADFFRMRDGRLVLQAVIHGAPNLFRSFVLGIIVIVCLGFYSYAYFSHSVNVSQELCHSPFQCVSKHILDSMTGDLTTVLGDDFGGFAYPALAVWKDSWNAWRSLFVFCSIIFWVFLLQGIIQGQIIDAFAEKRNQDEYLRDDLEKKCFVSSIDRFVFNAYPGEWEKRRGGKYAWQYLLYFTYLGDKDEDEYDGLENEVSQAFQRGDIDFLPIEQLAARQRSELEEPKEDAKAATQDLHARVQGLEGEVAGLRQAAVRILAQLKEGGGHADRGPPELQRDGSSWAENNAPAAPIRDASQVSLAALLGRVAAVQGAVQGGAEGAGGERAAGGERGAEAADPGGARP